MLGQSITAAASALGISYQAVRQWPDDLPPKIADRVFAAFVRLHPNDWQSLWPDLAHSTSEAPHV
nr:Cro/CI family transcriptional regulator [Achromobacter sp. ES-001]